MFNCKVKSYNLRKLLIGNKIIFNNTKNIIWHECLFWVQKNKNANNLQADAYDINDRPRLTKA